MIGKSVLCITVALLLINNPFNYAQQKNSKQQLTHQIDGLSSGALFDFWLQKEIKEGRINQYEVENYLRRNAKRRDKPAVNVNSITSMTSFTGFGYDDNSTETSGYSFIPPDPIAAAGTDRVIAVVNVMIECRDKTGTLIFRDALKDFFTSLSPATFTFDPKVIFDQYESRFLVVTLEKEESGSNPDASNTSKIFLAVSKTATPASSSTDDWYFHSINSKISIDGLDTWADYPGFAIDEEAVYITNNMFTHEVSGSRTNKGVRLWIVDKGTSGGFYDGGSATRSTNIYNPYSSSGYDLTTQPAHVFGAGGISAGVGTYLVGYSGLTGSGNEFIQWVRVDDPIGTPSFTVSTINMGDIDDTDTSMPDAPQLGSAELIETNDRRALHAVWRSNLLWLTTTVVPGSGDDNGEATAYWIKLSASGGTPTSSDKGSIGGEDIATDTYTFFPSVAVNSSGDAIFGFSASASTIYAGAYYAGRASGDDAGTVRESQTIKAGLASYIRTFGGTKNRWGDYTGTSVDPSDDETFWVFNQYADTKSGSTDGYGHDGRWGTVYAKVPVSALPVELSGFEAVAGDNSVTLFWQTSTETNNYGFEIERSVDYPIEGIDEWINIGFVQGHGTSYSPKFYEFIDNDPPVGDLKYRLKQIDLDGTFKYYSATASVSFGVTSATGNNLPSEFVLYQNYPNPFNPNTTISFSLPRADYVTLKIYDILGNEIELLINNEWKEAGTHDIIYSAKNNKLSSGVFFYNLQTGNFSETRKIVLLK